MSRILKTLAAFVVGLSLPAQALAQCAMCGTAFQDKTDPLAQSISSSILFMASMPFVLVFGVAGWLFYRFRQAPGDEENQQENLL